MNTIMTVQGPVSPGNLGFCQCHEHLALSKGVSFQRNAALLIDDIGKSTEEANRLVAAGGSAVVDAQPGGCNRMEQALFEISKESGLHIVSSTGFHKLCFYPEDHWILQMSADELYRFYVSELTEGMYQNIDHSANPFWSGYSSEETPQTGIHAGIVKMALDQENLTPRYLRLFTAGTRAAIAADVPVMVHIEAGSDPTALFAELRQLGLSPERMIFCHMDRATDDLSVHLNLLSQGIYLEYDTIGRFKYHSDLREIEIFRTMLNAGYENQLLFSLDTTSARLKAYDPSAVGLDYLLTTFVPLMKKYGITAEQIRKISHDNFIRVFTGQTLTY